MKVDRMSDAQLNSELETMLVSLHVDFYVVLYCIWCALFRMT